MGYSRQIYVSKKTERLIEEIKKDDPLFNLSHFVEISLNNYVNKTAAPDTLTTNLKLLQAQAEEVNRKVQLIQSEIADRQTKDIKEEADRIREKEISIGNFTDYALRTIPKFFELSQKELKEVSEQYALHVYEVGVKKAPAIQVFVEERGYKRKNE